MSLFENAKKQTVIKIDYSDVDRVISDHYGITMESCAVEEWSNYMDKEITVHGILDNREINDLEGMLDNGRWSMGAVRLCLNDLASKGLIEKGVYIIDVFW
jgi:hypothetical protein